jgi:hypothetical protein
MTSSVGKLDETGGERMKIHIRPRGVTVSRKQCLKVENELRILLARYGARIDRVIVVVSDAVEAGLTCCEIEVRFKPQLLKVVHSDTDVLVAVGHAAQRVVRSVSRAIETDGLVRH